MNPLQKNAIFLLLIAALLFTGCELFSGTPASNDNPNTGYTWAIAKALEKVNDEYPDRVLNIISFRSDRVDFHGQLDENMQAPFWVIELIDEEFYRYYVYVFQYHTAVTLSEYQHPDDPLWGNYTDTNIRLWIAAARSAYRMISGKRDDVSYRVYCASRYDSDPLSITLYDKRHDGLARIELNSITGDIEEVDLY